MVESKVEVTAAEMDEKMVVQMVEGTVLSSAAPMADSMVATMGEVKAAHWETQ